MKVSQKTLFLILGFFLCCSMAFPVFVAGYWIEPPPPANHPKKLAFFIWSSDVATQGIIDPYVDIVLTEGYLPFCYEDPDIYDVLGDIDALEDYNDKLFFYFYGHGIYDGLPPLSRFYYHGSSKISSVMLKSKFDLFESEKIAVLIESCYSGEFIDQFNVDGYLFMTTASRNLTAKAYGPSFPAEGIFSDFFWGYIDQVFSCLSAFFETKALNSQEPDLPWPDTYWPFQDPKYCINVADNFF
jgi:hypothetical protein